MFIDFLFELRRAKLAVGLPEAVALARALALGLHGSSLEQFYLVSRAILVHRESDLDKFDVAFAHHFRDVAGDAENIGKEFLEWLEDVAHRPDKTELERAL